MRVSPDAPFQNLPALPPRLDVETSAVLKCAIAANRSLARVDQASKLMPDPTVLINVIPLLESQASSEIENIVTTNDELFRAAHDVSTFVTPATREALRYRSALRGGFESIENRPLSTNTARLVCSTINDFDTDIRKQPGTYIGNPLTKERIYTPPEGQTVIIEHLACWEDFLHENESTIDPLIKMALLHYQFEAIHPFSDGNGRTGRILNMLYLVQADLLSLPITYLSGYIVRHKDTYYSLLNGVTQEEQWEPWICFMLRAVESTSLWTLDLINSIVELQDAALTRIQTRLNQPRARDLVDLLFHQPYVRSADVVNYCHVTRQTAARWLGELADIEIVKRTEVGRSAVFVNTSFLARLFTTTLAD